MLRHLGICVLLAGCGDPPSELVVFAASSLATPLGEIAAGFERANPNVRVRVHVAGSSALRRQIESGAPCDVFIAADTSDMQALRRRGLVTESTLLTRNELVVLTHRDAPALRTLADLRDAGIAHIAIGNRRTAPVGRYAFEAISRAGLLAELEPKLVPCESARQVASYVATGAADAGLAFRTDAWLDARLRVRVTVPDTLHAPIEYRIGALRGARDAGLAARFVRHASGAQMALARHGFGALEAQPDVPPPLRRTSALAPFWLSLRVAGVATLVAAIFGLFVAARLAAAASGFKRDVVAAIIDLPLLLPPTVIGIALLELFGPHGPVGSIVQRTTGIQIAFTWGAAVIASAIMALPLMVRTARAALESVPRRYVQAARTLGATPWSAFWSVRLPLARRGVIAALVLCFFRAAGEFGATLMVAGNIPERTRTLPLAIYSAVFEGRPHEAMAGVVAVAVLSLVGAIAAQRLVRRTP